MKHIFIINPMSGSHNQLEETKEACTYAHSINKKVYVTVNIVFHDEDTEGITEYLKKLDALVSEREKSEKKKSHRQ